MSHTFLSAQHTSENKVQDRQYLVRMDWMNDSITHSLIHSEIIISRELRGQIFRKYWSPTQPSGVQLSGLLVKEFWKSIRTLFLFVPFCWEDSILKEHVRCYFYSTWRFSFLLYEAHSKLMTLGDQRPWGKLTLPYHLPGTERLSPLPSIFPKSSTTLCLPITDNGPCLSLLVHISSNTQCLVISRALSQPT